MRPEKKRRIERRKRIKNTPNPGIDSSFLQRFAAESLMIAALQESHATPAEVLLLSQMIEPALAVLRAGGSIEMHVPKDAKPQ
jgi:hypothetical protein